MNLAVNNSNKKMVSINTPKKTKHSSYSLAEQTRTVPLFDDSPINSSPNRKFSLNPYPS